MTSGDMSNSDDRPVFRSSQRHLGDGGDDTGREALTRAMEATVTDAIGGGLNDSADLESVREVVRRHAGHPLSLEPVVRELVMAILASRMGPAVKTTGAWESTGRVIADTLWEDLPSRDRLKMIWNRLIESLP